MRFIKLLILSAALAGGLAAPAIAQQAQGAQASSAASADMTEGEVRKVDKSAGKITVKHGEIKNLDMPPMTMVFAAGAPSMLDKVKAGDKVRFRAADQGGKLTLTEILPAN